MPAWCAVSALLPIFARDILMVGPWGLGLLRSMPAAGAVVHTANTFRTTQRHAGDRWDHLARRAVAIARGARAGCEVCIKKNYPVTVNDPALTEQMRPTLARVAGASHLVLVPKVMGSEDFSFFQREVPGLFFFVGNTPTGVDPLASAPNHSPRFFVDEGCLPLGVRAMAHVACDWLAAAAG